jgi:hypothetical protein
LRWTKTGILFSLVLSLIVVSSVWATPPNSCPTLTVSQIKNSSTIGIATGQFGASNCVTVNGQLVVGPNPSTPSTISSITDETGTISLNNVDIPISLNSQTVTLIGQISVNPPGQLFALQISSPSGQILFQEQILTIVTSTSITTSTSTGLGTTTTATSTGTTTATTPVTTIQPTIPFGPQHTSVSTTDAIIAIVVVLIVGYLIVKKQK